MPCPESAISTRTLRFFRLKIVWILISPFLFMAWTALSRMLMNALFICSGSVWIEEGTLEESFMLNSISANTPLNRETVCLMISWILVDCIWVSGMRAKLENSSTRALIVPASLMMVLAPALIIASCFLLFPPNFFFILSAESWIGVRGFLIS
ncbi:hypothetical protein ES703_67032 [subsurface metagenome]